MVARKQTSIKVDPTAWNEAKQNLKIEHSPTKVITSQLNHIFLSVCGFIKLERLRLNYKMNHFAIKEKIYIEALRSAYQKVEKLECA
ncbi:MAG TPA: hypothetical protein ENK82_03020 [Campylobacterales bacterium]|nr:hypothetical protein [Campylobacterales bacterium]HHS92291.1 hypothetical protein [Campylobacterales bacterium]